MTNPLSNFFFCWKKQQYAQNSCLIPWVNFVSLLILLIQTKFMILKPNWNIILICFSAKLNIFTRTNVDFNFNNTFDINYITSRILTDILINTKQCMITRSENQFSVPNIFKPIGNHRLSNIYCHLRMGSRN